MLSNNAGNTAPTAAVGIVEVNGLKYPAKKDGRLKGGAKVTRPANVTAFAVDRDAKSGKLTLRLVIELSDAVHMTGDSDLTRDGNAGKVYAEYVKLDEAFDGVIDTVTGKPIVGTLPGRLLLTMTGPRQLPSQKLVEEIHAAGSPKAAKPVRSL